MTSLSFRTQGGSNHRGQAPYFQLGLFVQRETTPFQDSENAAEHKEENSKWLQVLQASPARSSAAQLGPALAKPMGNPVKGPHRIARTLLQGLFKMVIQCVHGGHHLYFFVLLLYSDSIFVYWREKENFLKINQSNWRRDVIPVCKNTA